MEIRSGAMLPARREEIELHTEDGLTLVGELALPLEGEPSAVILCLHPLPTHGGFMDSHVLKKASNRLPALAGIGVLRFNFRGVSAPRGTSEGAFDGGVGERFDLLAALQFLRDRGLPTPWLMGWSFGTEVLLMHAAHEEIAGAILLSPPLHRASDEHLVAWHGNPAPLVAVVPEFDDYLRPDAARERFAILPEMQIVPIPGGKHLWVGETQVRQVLNEVVRLVNPEALPLPNEWHEAE
ncbi:alpha/beta hydrolase [Humidisolicoccus flavus]|uniref:alpha/beta hydrolase n=1 Tax=Humidisolicoccus flavus TaxID=3111414 RepID=UPI0032523DB0